MNCHGGEWRIEGEACRDGQSDEGLEDGGRKMEGV
jgi:hypothetical protein